MIKNTRLSTVTMLDRLEKYTPSLNYRDGEWYIVLSTGYENKNKNFVDLIRQTYKDILNGK